ncbi:MAG: stage II sporulation protein P, partial [Clostridia bacterium]|nr:stage II sporulation protein P [Clostridia bacterium]
MNEHENAQNRAPDEKYEKDCAKEESADAGPGGSALPVDIEKVFSENPPFNQRRDKQESAGERSNVKDTLMKVLSVIISMIFCGTALLCIASNAVQSARGLTKENVKSYLIKEVYGENAKVSAKEAPFEEDSGVPETSDAPEGDEAQDESADSEPQETQSTASPESADEYPIVYESLANTDILTELINETSYEPSADKLLSSGTGIASVEEIHKEYGDDAPAVLIVHTHGTESYVEEGTSAYTENTSFRTEDVAKNVVSVGSVMAKVLESQGIGVIHCEEMFDKESYRDSYSRSYAAIKKYLNEYPSIKYVFDVHRDSVIRADMTNVATYAEFEGERTAQVMCVVGTDEGGADHKNWQTNLSLALSIQKEMAELEPTLPRRINLRSAAFNQALSPGSLLLEVGSCANTLAEAKRAAVLCAVAISEAIT